MPILASSPVFECLVLKDLLGDSELSDDITVTINLDSAVGEGAHIC